MAQLFAAFEKQWLVYEQMSTNRRKKTLLVLQRLKKVKVDLADFETIMAGVSEKVVLP